MVWCYHTMSSIVSHGVVLGCMAWCGAGGGRVGGISTTMASWDAHEHVDGCCGVDPTMDSCCARDRRERKQALAHKHALEEADALGWRRKHVARRFGAPSTSPASPPHAPWTSSEPLLRFLASTQPHARAFVYVCAPGEESSSVQAALERATCTWHRCTSPLWSGAPRPPALALVMDGRVASTCILSDASSSWDVARWIATRQTLDPDVMDAMDDEGRGEAQHRRDVATCQQCTRTYPHEHVAVPTRRSAFDEEDEDEDEDDVG